MAKSKVDFKKLLLEKGEKYGLIAATVAMALLVFWGISTAIGAASSDQKAGEIKSKATSLRDKINSNNGADKLDPLDQTLLTKLDFPGIPPEKHRNDPFFVSLQLEGDKRVNPKILAPTEFQVDFFRGVYLSYNFIKGANGELQKIYVIKERQKEKVKEIARNKEGWAKLKDPKPPQRGNGPGQPGRPGMPGGGPGGGGSGRGGMGSGGGAGAGGSMGSGGGGMGAGGGGGAGIGGGAASKDTLTVLEVANLKDFLDPGSKFIAAQFIRPLQCVIVQASFPFKQEMEEFRKALGYQTLSQLVASKEDEPKFLGFIVERRVHYPTGEASEWAEFNWQEYYYPYFHEKILEDQPEDESLKQFIPPPSAKLFVPLPKLARGHYAPLALDSIKRAMEKGGDSGKRIAPSGGGKLEGEGDLFSPGGEGGATKPAAPSPADSKDNKDEKVDVNDAFLMRFLDVDVHPGYAYEYRIRMRLANPNFEKKDLVRRPDYAEGRELLSEPAVVTFMDGGKPTSIVHVPVDREIFAYYSDSRDTRDSKVDHAYVQVQSWMEHIRPDRSRAMDENNAETVGDWMVEDISVARGQDVFQVKPVKVPIWSAKDNFYHFMEFSSNKSLQRYKGTFPIDISAPDVLVDFEGGKSMTEVRGRSKGTVRDITDESGLELLFLDRQTGKLHMRSYWQDMVDSKRFEREATWAGWLKAVKDAADKEKDKDNKDKDNPFQKK